MAKRGHLVLLICGERRPISIVAQHGALMFAHTRPVGGQRCYYGSDRLSCEATTHFHPKSQKNGRQSDGVSKRCRGLPPVGWPVLIGQARSEVMCRGGLGAFDWGQMHVCSLTGSVCRPSAALHKAAGSYKAQREVLHPFRAENNSMTAQFSSSLPTL